MNIITHSATFVAAIVALWFFAGLIVDSIDRVASKFNKSGFIVAFFLLGFLTSLGEISVAINSVIDKVPQIAVGNLVGASFVLLVFVVPVLAVTAGKVTMHTVFDKWRLLYVLFIISLPSLFLIDGIVSPREGIATVLFLVSLLWVIKNNDIPRDTTKIIVAENSRSPLLDVGKVIIGALVIFFAGHLLVEETVYFAEIFIVPKSFVGMIVLSLGTNIPEIAIALRSVLKNRSEVALGNYLGSATMNTAIFCLIAIVSGPFMVNKPEFIISFLFTIVGFILFYFFIRSKDVLNRKEGIILLILYGGFLATHVLSLINNIV